MKASKRRTAPESETLAVTLQSLSDRPADRAKRVQRFVADLDHCLERIVDACAPGAVHVWTIGDRHVGGRRVPLRQIFCELAASRGLQHKGAITRALPSQRRMASRNQRGPADGHRGLARVRDAVQPIAPRTPTTLHLALGRLLLRKRAAASR